jgi:hypothetical protein
MGLCVFFRFQNISPQQIDLNAVERKLLYLLSHPQRAGRRKRYWLTSDGETAETELLLESDGLADGGLGGDDDRVEDETVLVALDLADHLGLLVGGAVVVDNTETTEEGHVDGHVVLGDGVHGGGEEGSLEGDALSDGRVKGDLVGGEAWIDK